VIDAVAVIKQHKHFSAALAAGSKRGSGKPSKKRWQIMPDNGEPSVQQLFDLNGRVGLITGASGYLGFSMASALAEAGCRVVVASRNLKTARRTAAKLSGAQKGRDLFVPHTTICGKCSPIQARGNLPIAGCCRRNSNIFACNLSLRINL
jgi:hypothetical protein